MSESPLWIEKMSVSSDIQPVYILLLLKFFPCYLSFVSVSLCLDVEDVPAIKISNNDIKAFWITLPHLNYCNQPSTLNITWQ